jgi:ribosomal protein S18 acetylase RimI-like enzyme
MQGVGSLSRSMSCAPFDRVMENKLAMDLEFREARSQEVWRRSHGDEPMHPDIASGRMIGWECVHHGKVIGHCAADSKSGEIIGISVLPPYRSKGIGAKLLSNVVDRLRAGGFERVWLAAPSDPDLPAYKFYRALGWRPTGELTMDGLEILELLKGLHGE